MCTLGSFHKRRSSRSPTTPPRFSRRCGARLLALRCKSLSRCCHWAMASLTDFFRSTLSSTVSAHLSGMMWCWPPDFGSLFVNLILSDPSRYSAVPTRAPSEPKTSICSLIDCVSTTPHLLFWEAGPRGQRPVPSDFSGELPCAG